jgi:prepilin-type processing-associated H-X9-DG protein
MSNTTPPTTDPPAKSKPLQFTLRSMFVVMIVLAVLLGMVMQFGCLRVLLSIALVASIAVSIYKRDWRYVLGTFGIVIVVGLLLPAFQAPRTTTRRYLCKCNLKQIGLALHNYHDRYGSFPPAYIADEDGKPMHSWRVLLLPFVEESNLYEEYRFDEPWDGPNNRKLHKQVVSIYRCPSATDNDIMTSYVAVVGPATAWPGSESTKFKDFSDGASNTIMIVEMANSGIHWMEPRDLHVLKMHPWINAKSSQAISSNHPGGACVLFADGSVRFLPTGFSPDKLKALLTIDGGEEVSPDDWE